MIYEERQLYNSNRDYVSGNSNSTDESQDKESSSESSSFGDPAMVFAVQEHEHMHSHLQVDTNHHTHTGMNDMSSGPITMIIAMSNSSAVFCNQDKMSMIMYMDGFHWTTQYYFYHQANRKASSTSSSSSQSPLLLPCLNILSPQLTVSTIEQFYIACVLVCCLSISIEGVSKYRNSYFRKLQINGRMTLATNDHNPNRHLYSRNSNSSCSARYDKMKCQAILSLLHGCQALLGYGIMLIVMTFSIELFISVLIGLMIGYYIFIIYPSFMDLHESNNVIPEVTVVGNDANHYTFTQQQQQQERTVRLRMRSTAAALSGTSANPCCDFLTQPST